MSRPTYRIDAEKHEGWWLLTSTQVPGAVSQVRRLTAADEHAREAVAFVLGVKPDSFDLDVVPALGGALDSEVCAAREAVRAAAAAQREAADRSRKVVAELAKKGLTGAEVAAVLHLSAQRVSQLLSGQTATRGAPKTGRRAARSDTPVAARAAKASSASVHTSSAHGRDRKISARG